MREYFESHVVLALESDTLIARINADITCSKDLSHSYRISVQYKTPSGWLTLDPHNRVLREAGEYSWLIGRWSAQEVLAIDQKPTLRLRVKPHRQKSFTTQPVSIDLRHLVKK